jgi:hypothetical protein
MVLAAWLASTGCSKPPAAVSRAATEPNVAAAERVIDAFYSFDRDRLAGLLAAAEASAPAILFYQGWAQGGTYRVRHRAPCQPEAADRVRCAITVEDDLIKALRLDVQVTDTFRITVAGGRVRQVATSSNDPPLFEEALAWVRRERAERIRVPCEGFFAGGPTPAACVRAIVQGFAEFVAHRRPS